MSEQSRFIQPFLPAFDNSAYYRRPIAGDDHKYPQSESVRVELDDIPAIPDNGLREALLGQVIARGELSQQAYVVHATAEDVLQNAVWVPRGSIFKNRPK